MPQDPAGSKLVFVGGAARSGTTLVQNMLDCHPRIYGGSVFVHVPAIVELRNRLHQALQAGWITDYSSRAEVDAHIADLLEDLLLPAARRAGREILSEKTTANVEVFCELMEILPAARFIRVVRDPRAVVSSLLQVGRRARTCGQPAPPFTQSMSAALQHTRARIAAGARAVARDPRRVHTVVYEALVREPQVVGRGLCTFLDVPWTPELLRPGARQHPAENVVAGSIWYPTRESYYRDPEPGREHRWRDELSFIQQCRISAALADDAGIRHLGYELSGPRRARWWAALGVLEELANRTRDGLDWRLRAGWRALQCRGRRVRQTVPRANRGVS